MTAVACPAPLPEFNGLCFNSSTPCLAPSSPRGPSMPFTNPSAPTISPPTSTPSSNSREVKVLTYNFFLRPPLVHNNSNDFKDERLDHFLQHEIQKFDVLCMQEFFAFLNHRRNLFLQQALQQGYQFYICSGTSTQPGPSSSNDPQRVSPFQFPPVPVASFPSSPSPSPSSSSSPLSSNSLPASFSPSSSSSSSTTNSAATSSTNITLSPMSSRRSLSSSSPLSSSSLPSLASSYEKPSKYTAEETSALSRVFWSLNQLLTSSMFSNFVRRFLDGGLVLLSRLPIVSHDFLHFSTGGVDADALTTKMVLHALVAFPESSEETYDQQRREKEKSSIGLPSAGLHVFTTHLQSSYLHLNDNLKHEQIRMQQVKEMSQFVQYKIAETSWRYPALITGDLNVDCRVHNRKSSKIDSKGTIIDDDDDELNESLEYQEMMFQFNPKHYSPNSLESEAVSHVVDLLKAHSNGRHPVTIGDVIISHLDEENEGDEGDEKAEDDGDDNNAEEEGCKSLIKATEDKEDQSNENNSKNNIKETMKENDKTKRFHYVPRETQLTEFADHLCQQSKDYMIFVNTFNNRSVHVKDNSCQVEQFFLHGTKLNREIPRLSQLSDHYGVSTTFLVNHTDDLSLPSAGI